MSIYAISSFSASFILYGLAIFVYLNSRKKFLNRIYAIQSIVIGSWIFGCFGESVIKNYQFIFVWDKALNIFAVFSIPVFVHTYYAILGYRSDKYVKFFYFLAIALAIISFNPMYINGVEYRYGVRYISKPGPLYSIFIGGVMYGFLLSLIKLSKAMKTSDSHKKLQLKYVLIATICMFIAAIIYLAMVLDIAISPLDNTLNSLYGILIAYAIVRHQLMDIEVIIKKTLVFAGLLASVFLMLILPTLIIQEHLFRGAGIGARLIGLTISGIIIIFTMRRIESSLINITDKYLFQKKYDYKELLKTFTEEVLTVLDLRQLIDLTKDKLTEIIKMESCDVLLFDDEKETPTTASKGERIISLTLNNRNIGVLKLGKKKSDEDYTQDDMDILLPLARTLAIAISNAHLFDELGKAQAEAAQKEKMATIGTLAAGMAHEIRNPITTIRTFADYLPERFKDTDFINRFQKLIPQEIGKIETIAQSLLELSYAGEGSESKESFDIYDSIKAICSLLEMQYRYSGFHISYDINGSAMIFANKNQIHEAFFNIITYIFAETSKGSTVEIEVRKNGENVSVFIRDKGLIISDYIIRDVFEPVSKMTLGRRGFGFRLLISKQIVEKNGGSLAIISDAGKGAEVIIKF